MERKTLSKMIPTLLLVSMLTLGFNIKQAKAEGTYNVTTGFYSMLGETLTQNDQKTKFITVTISVHPERQVGIKTGDWIKLNCTSTGAPSGTTVPTWMKVEFLSVKGTNATMRVTMHMSDGTEQSKTMPVGVMTGGGTYDIFSGFVIPANSATGDSIYITGYGNITIAGEATRTYAGASRTAVYASFSQAHARYYWDKQTGVVVEASVSSGGITITAKAADTNMWGIVPFWMQWWFWAIVAVGIVILAGAIYMKKRKPPTSTSLPSEA